MRSMKNERRILLEAKQLFASKLGERRSTQRVEPEHCSGRSERPTKDGRAGAERSRTHRAMDGRYRTH